MASFLTKKKIGFTSILIAGIAVLTLIKLGLFGSLWGPIEYRFKNDVVSPQELPKSYFFVYTAPREIAISGIDFWTGDYVFVSSHITVVDAKRRYLKLVGLLGETYEGTSNKIQIIDDSTLVIKFFDDRESKFKIYQRNREKIISFSNLNQLEKYQTWEGVWERFNKYTKGIKSNH